MTSSDSQPPTLPTNSVWESLLAGDPGPTVALFDSLLDGDFAHAAGGMLRDLADGVVDVNERVSGDDEQKLFLETVQSAMLACLQNDAQQVNELLAEAKAG